MEHRWRVVTGFLTRDGERGKEGKWAGISGSMEPGEACEAAMWRELQEETTFTNHDVTLVRTGLPLDIDHEGRQFRVHPFLYQVLWPHITPTIDFEHTTYQWFTPHHLEEMDVKGQTVPQLLAAYHRVADPVDRLEGRYQCAARYIFDNRTSGASELAIKAAQLVEAGADPIRVAALRPTMVALVQAALAASDSTRNIPFELKADAEKAALIGQECLKMVKSVATFSKSSTVIGTLKLIKTPIRVLVGRSTPGDEGLLTADIIRAAGHMVTVLDDDELYKAIQMKEVEMVIVGADAVLTNGDVVNKVGTTRLAVAAQAVNMPFIVLAE
eukprot:Ihof_evm15s37 gene=Ihof_evmTU15s37